MLCVCPQVCPQWTGFYQSVFVLVYDIPEGIVFLSLMHLPGQLSALALSSLMGQSYDGPRKRTFVTTWEKVRRKVFPGDSCHSVCPPWDIRSIYPAPTPKNLFFLSVDIRFLGSLAGWKSQDFILVVLIVIYSIYQPSYSHHQGEMVRARSRT